MAAVVVQDWREWSWVRKSDNDDEDDGAFFFLVVTVSGLGGSDRVHKGGFKWDRDGTS
jgi:hypothetical protein